MRDSTSRNLSHLEAMLIGCKDLWHGKLSALTDGCQLFITLLVFSSRFCIPSQKLGLKICRLTTTQNIT